MGDCPAAARTNCWPARGSTSRPTSAIPAISCCGSRRRPICRAGTARGAAAGPAGTSSAAPCRGATSARRFDIHGGGTDLIFPHHENEMAQSVCAFPGSHFARYWVHNGMLLVNGEKMSKSLGNFITLRDVLAKRAGRGGAAAAAAHALPLDAGFLRRGGDRGASANSTGSIARWSDFPDVAAADVPAAGDGGAVRRPEHAAGAVGDACAGRRARWPATSMRRGGLRAAGAAAGAAAAATRAPGSAAATRRCRRDRGRDRRTAGRAQGPRLRARRRDPRRVGGEGHRAGGRARGHHLAARH